MKAESEAPAAGSVEERRFAAIVTTDVDAKTHGFFWCGGTQWESRDYRCILVAVPFSGKRKIPAAAVSLTADSPEELANAMGAYSIEPLPAEAIRDLCESAGRSPHLERRGRPKKASNASARSAPKSVSERGASLKGK